MLEHTDGHDLVKLRMDFTKVRFAHLEAIGQFATADFLPQPVNLLGGGIGTAHFHTVLLGRVKHESAESATDVDHAFSRREPYLSTHVLDLVALCLFDIACAFLPVATRVHHQFTIQPVAVEIFPVRVVKSCVGFGLGDTFVRKTKFVPIITQPG